MANTKITSRVIADNAVTTAAIADDAITSAKLDTNIAVAGTLTVTGDITGTLATAAQPNITSIGTLTGLTGGTGDLNWDSGTLFVDSSANDVGIGTTTPTDKLDVAAPNSQFRLTDTDDATFTQFSSSGGKLAIRQDSTSADHVFLNASGNVGIGTSSPTEDLTIASTSPQIRFEDTDASGTPYSKVSGVLGNIYIQADDGNEIADSKIDFRVDGTQRMVIDSSGNVGIGTTNPLTLFQVKVATNNNFMVQSALSSTALKFLNDGGTSYIAGTINAGTLSINGDSGGNLGIGKTPNRSRKLEVAGTMNLDDGSEYEWGDGSISIGGNSSTDVMTFATASAERMRITANGAIKMPSSVFSQTDKYHLFTNDQAGEFVQILEHKHTSASDGSGPHGMQISFTGVAPNQTNRYFFRCGDTSALRIIIDSQGNITNQNNSYGQISDEKLKENIVDATPKLDGLMQLQIKNFNFIGDDKKQLGVIAQQVETIFPNLIDERKDTHPTTNEDLGTTTKSVKYSVFVPMLIKAMQEQQTIIDDLKSRIETLEG